MNINRKRNDNVEHNMLDTNPIQIHNKNNSY